MIPVLQGTYRSFAIGAAVGCAAALAGGFPSLAWAGDEMERARTHYLAGEALYRLRDYTDAIREFSAGYALAQRPPFLLNLGQAYRMRGDEGDLERAREMFRRYLDTAPASDKQRAKVEALLAELALEIDARAASAAAAAAAAPSAPATVASLPVPAPVAAPTVETSASAVGGAVALTPVAPSKPARTRPLWVLAPVGAAVVAGVAVGIYFGVRPSPFDCASLSLGCVDPAH